MTATLQRVGRAVKAAFDADGLTVFQYNEPAGGQTVFQIHLHLLAGAPLGRFGTPE